MLDLRLLDTYEDGLQARRLRAHARHYSRRNVSELTASGTAADLRARIAEYRRSGIALPTLMPVQSGPDSIAGVVETLRAGAG